MQRFLVSTDARWYFDQPRIPIDQNSHSRVWLWSMHMNAASLASLLPIRHRHPNFLESDWCCWPLQMNPCWHGGAHPRCRAGWRKETRGRFTLATGAQYFITVHRDGIWNEQTGGVDQRIMGCQRDTRIFRYPSVRRSMFWDEYDKPMRSHDKPNQFLSVWNQGLEFQVQFPFFTILVCFQWSTQHGEATATEAGEASPTAEADTLWFTAAGCILLQDVMRHQLINRRSEGPSDRVT